MRNLKFLIIFLLMAASAPVVFAQTEQVFQAEPVFEQEGYTTPFKLSIWNSWAVPPDATTIYILDLGLLGSGTFELLEKTKHYGLHAAPVYAFGNDFNGVQISPMFTLTRDLNGISVSGLISVNTKFNGILISALTYSEKGGRGFQLSPLAAMCGKECTIYGLQAAPFNWGKVQGLQLGAVNFNKAVKGLQAGLINSGADEINGLQIGCINKIDLLKNGVQLGIINYAGRMEKGVQIGAINVSPEGFLIVSPLVNARF
ncbi:LA_2272 family surface repeat-containing protein [Elusimicrobium minutum]|nr:hypothetical protein [Elusimicrobium minutum]